MYNFSNTRYEWSHGKTPRGRGRWAFEKGEKIWWADNCLTLTEAKKQITQTLKAAGIPAGTTIYVAP